MANDHKHKFAAIILAAGNGKRMRSALPKVMHKLAGEPMIAHVLSCVKSLEPDKAVLVVAPQMDVVKQAAQTVMPQCAFAIQDKQSGTGHAVSCAQTILKNYEGTVVILYGDTPLIQAETLAGLLDAMDSADFVTLGMRLADPTGYGRLIVDSKGQLEEIIECKDAKPDQKAVTLCNSGVMAVKGKYLFELLKKIQPNNSQGEYYLTDIVGHADQQALHCRVVEADPAELAGINTRVQLAEAENELQTRLRVHAMDQGATLVDPKTVYLCADTRIGKDVIIYPGVVFGPGVTIADNVEIRSFSHIEGARIEKNAIIGPFARLRPGSSIGEGAHVGNFVELKKTTLGKNAKANHLSYVGDTDVGEEANIGAGTITCNYDGIDKHKTLIGSHAFIGSNVSLIAPVTVGEGAMVGAGSVITQDVEADALAVARAPQVNKAAKAKSIKQRQKKS